MKFRNKGRKLYKTKEKNYYGKSPMGKFMSGVLSVLLIGGIGFIGYSVAEPIVNYSKKKGDDTSVSETTEAPSETDVSGEIVTTTEPDPYVQQPVSAEEYRAISFTSDDLATEEALKLALHRIPSGQNIEYVELPLKVSGGQINYSSNVLMASQLQPLSGKLSLETIVNTVREADYKPVAVVSAFNDSILPANYPQTGFVTTDTGEQWNDDDPAAGGRPWTTPNSETVRNYVADLLGEISGAGFEKVICTDMVYPQFRETDLAILDPVLSTPDRYKALTMSANMFNERILSKGSTMMLEISAVDILKNNDDIISQPMLLNVQSLVLNINIDDIRYGVYASDTNYEFSGTASDMVKTMLENDKIKQRLNQFSNVVIRISGSSVGIDELLKAKEEVAAHKYISFVVG